MAFGLALLTGCAIPSWPWGNSPHKIPPPGDATTSSVPPKSSGSQTDAQALQQVMSELQQVGALDPAAQDKLMADLKQVDPSLWPMVLQTFRAEAAYKRRAELREAAKQKSETTDADARREYPQTRTAGTDKEETRFEFKSADGQTTIASKREASNREERIDALAPLPSSLSIPNPEGRPALSPEPPVTGGIDARSAMPAAAAEKPSRSGGATLEPASTAARLTAIRREASTGGPAGNALATGATPLSEADWQAHLTAAIRSIEMESKAGSKSESDVALQARLRMLYLLAGRRDDAMRPLPAAPQAAQDYWSSQIYGLSTWMDAEKTPDSGRRAAETKRILGEALAQLSETAPLAVRNLTFCTEVSRFGSFDALKSTEFTSGQKVLLYAEIDNLHIESSAKGYHWAVKINGQVFDKDGKRMADYGFAPADETYQTPRHDFFVSKLYYLPRLAPGRYTLQLTIEDTLGHKVGQSSIDFTIKPQ